MAKITAVGITGTRQGMTSFQLEAIENILTFFMKFYNELLYFRHGDCLGADAEGHDIADKLGYQPIIHPPTNPKYRAFKKSNIILPEYPYLTRDRHIVNNSNLMLATPNSRKYNQRSGTWYTYNYAEKQQVPRILIHIDGEILPEGKEIDWKNYLVNISKNGSFNH